MSAKSLRKTVRRASIILLALAIGALVYLPGDSGRVVARDIGADGSGRVALLSRSFTIDRLYQSMMGPSSHHEGIRLVESNQRRLLWLTGIRCELVGTDGKSVASQDFFCHSNLTFAQPPESTRPEPEGRTTSAEGRLFTLIPGRMDLSLPNGFAIPVYSDEPLDCFTMSLNLNHRGQPVQFRFRTTVQFAQDSTQTTMTPLFRRALYAYEPIDKQSPHAMCMGGDSNGATCGPFIGKAASNAFLASLGKTNTVHWYIPPGHFESHVNMTEQLDLPYDTTAHYVTAHLHPFGKSLSLVDKTDGKTLVTIHAKDFTDRLGVESMEQWSSADGLQLIKGHEYELVTEYHNPTDKPIDAMSILYVYARDKTFRAARQPTVSAPSPKMTENLSSSPRQRAAASM